MYKDTYEQVISMLDDGMSPMEISEALDLDFQTVLDIQQDFEHMMKSYG